MLERHTLALLALLAICRHAVASSSHVDRENALLQVAEAQVRTKVPQLMSIVCDVACINGF